MKIIAKWFDFIFTKSILLHSNLNGVDCTHAINTFRFCFLWDYNLQMKLVNLKLEVLLQYCQLSKYCHLPYISFMFQTQLIVLKKRTHQHHNSDPWLMDSMPWFSCFKSGPRNLFQNTKYGLASYLFGHFGF